MITNAPLSYPPRQLALTALCIANLSEPKIDFDGYLQTLLHQIPLQQLIVNLDAIEELVNVENREPSQIQLRYIDCKIRCYRDSCLLQKR